MKKLYVLYDPNCVFCRRCRRWLSDQSSYFELVFLPVNSAEAAARIAGIESFSTTGELTVVSDEGAVYQGPNAFIMCLYALTDFREWSLRLSRPALLPFARQMFEFISNNRAGFSKWLSNLPDEDATVVLQKCPPPICGSNSGQCKLTPVK